MSFHFRFLVSSRRCSKWSFVRGAFERLFKRRKEVLKGKELLHVEEDERERETAKKRRETRRHRSTPTYGVVRSIRVVDRKLLRVRWVELLAHFFFCTYPLLFRICLFVSLLLCT
uniref:Transmembrane protein n=1 Tax=Trypanosoma congolense (strain IL3000) TaxID=1068625 RepID=G0UQP6_TRYCI|nr:hypothetical protein, unlikely [Trypanosoma congolense IL3000]